MTFCHKHWRRHGSAPCALPGTLCYGQERWERESTTPPLKYINNCYDIKYNGKLESANVKLQICCAHMMKILCQFVNGFYKIYICRRLMKQFLAYFLNVSDVCEADAFIFNLKQNIQNKTDPPIGLRHCTKSSIIIFFILCGGQLHVFEKQ